MTLVPQLAAVVASAGMVAAAPFVVFVLLVAVWSVLELTEPTALVWFAWAGFAWCASVALGFAVSRWHWNREHSALFTRSAVVFAVLSVVFVLGFAYFLSGDTARGAAIAILVCTSPLVGLVLSNLASVWKGRAEELASRRPAVEQAHQPDAMSAGLS